MREAVKRMHPLIILVYYLFVLLISMVSIHPVIVGLSFVMAQVLLFLIKERKDVLRSMAFYLLIILVIAATNPLFSHNGETVLFYVGTGKYTLEAVTYGIVAGVMITSVMSWCESLGILMTTDGFLYLFGKRFGKLALLISMSVRYIPRLKRQFRNVHSIGKTLEISGDTSWIARVNQSGSELNALLSWSFENMIETADSMLARGYGDEKRTSYAAFPWKKRDTLSLLLIVFLGGYVFFQYGRGAFTYSFYPLNTVVSVTAVKMIDYMITGVLFSLPLIMDIKERLKWKNWKSGI